METLRTVRPDERFVLYHRRVCDKRSVAELLTDIMKYHGKILVITDHSDDVIEDILSEMDDHNCAYVFLQSELDVDPINSPMVPPHRLATADEIRRLSEQCIPSNMLPVLRMKDPIRRWYNFPITSIVAIDRPRGTYFRRVKSD